MGGGAETGTFGQSGVVSPGRGLQHDASATGGDGCGGRGRGHPLFLDRVWVRRGKNAKNNTATQAKECWRNHLARLHTPRATQVKNRHEFFFALLFLPPDALSFRNETPFRRNQTHTKTFCS